jgi:KDO2-lipid IV(A) lauroyltransferase
LLDVVKPQRNVLFDRYLARLRHEHGIGTVPAHEAARRVLAHLRTGGLVSLLVDQDAGKAGVRGNFLGRPASLWSGAARFSLLTGCPVVPMAILRRTGETHELRVGTALQPSAAGAEPGEVRRFTLQISRAVEVFVRQQPDQWFWVHRRWKGAAEAGGIHGEIPKIGGKEAGA